MCQFEELPYDVVYELVRCADHSTRRTLSLLNKKTRRIAIPLLFRNIRFICPDRIYGIHDVIENKSVCEATRYVAVSTDAELVGNFTDATGNSCRRLSVVSMSLSYEALPAYLWTTIFSCSYLECLDIRHSWTNSTSLIEFLSRSEGISLCSLRRLWIPAPDWAGIVKLCPNVEEFRITRLKSKIQPNKSDALMETVSMLLPKLRTLYWPEPSAAAVRGTYMSIVLYLLIIYVDIHKYFPAIEELSIVGAFLRDTIEARTYKF